MKAMRLPALGASILLLLSGCASDLKGRDIQTMGHAEVIYVDPPVNLYVYKPAPQANLGAGALTAAVTQLAHDLSGPEVVLMPERSQEISALGFDDKTYAMVTNLFARVPWLKGAKVTKWQKPAVMDDYTRGSPADAVVYVMPVFTLDYNNSQHFTVSVHVIIQQRDPRNRLWVHDFRNKLFGREHQLSLKTPGMTWEQQKEAAHALAGMNVEEARDLWFKDDGAMLKADFSQDLQQMEQEMLRFFGA